MEPGQAGPTAETKCLLFLDWVLFPKGRWKKLEEPTPVLKISALAFDVQEGIQVEEVSYNVHCAALQSEISDAETKALLGVSKVVYGVSNGRLEEILPALLDKLNPETTLAACWSMERFETELQPHLRRVLASASEGTRAAFSQVLVVKDAIKAESPSLVRSGPLETAEALHLHSPRQSALGATAAMFRHFFPTREGLETPAVTKALRAVGSEQKAIVIEDDRELYCEKRSNSMTAGGSPLVQGGGAVRGSTDVKEDKGPFVLRLRGLPWEATDKDIAAFLSPVVKQDPSPGQRDAETLPLSDILVITGSQGRCTGEAFVRLPTLAIRDACLAKLHGNLLGRRWIELFRATDAEMRDAREKITSASAPSSAYRSTLAPLSLHGASSPSSSSLNAGEVSAGAVLRLRGLPWGCTDHDIVRFFADGGFTVDLSHVALPSGRGTKSTGEAWVDLGTAARADDARRALHRKSIGSRYIEVFNSNAREFYQASRGNARIDNSGPPYRRATGSRTYEDSAPYSNSPRHCSRRLSPELRWAEAPTARAMVSCPPNVSYGVGPQSYGVATAGTPQSSFTVLRLRGLPYGSNETHIVQFFTGFSMTTILPSTVPVDGRPSGEAYVEFVSPEEAVRAFQLKQNARIEHRYIELFPASKQEMEMAASGLDSKEIKARLGSSSTASSSSSRAAPY